MITLEKAISRLEDIVSGSYKQKFLNSELRNNTKEAAELLKFSFMSLLKINRTTVKSAAIETILTTILDDTPLPEQWQKRGRITYLDNVQGMREEQNILNDPDVLNECIECCNVILKKVGSDDVLPESDRDGMTIRELNKRYINKYLYFRNDEIGSQYVWVKNIHKNTEGHFEIDGTVIFSNGVNNTIGLYEVQNHPVEDFYNFGDKNDRFTKCEDLDEALHEPMDTRLKNHIISCKEVVEDVLFTFTWFYEIHIPEIAKILKTMKFTD